MSNTYRDLPLTSFPDSVDSFAQFLDITSTDYSLVKQYQEALERGDYSGAQSALSQIPQNSQKIISSMRLNELREAIFALEKFYGTDIEDYVDTKQAEWNNRIEQFSYRGVYSPSTSYLKNNIVKYNANGLTSLYINISDADTPIGTAPTNTTYWQMFTERGPQGTSGTDTSFDFAWESSKLYSEGTIVVYANKWWYSTQENQNQEPTEGSEYWDLVLTITQPIYPVQETQPVGQGAGEIWFKII